eukprot:g2749.t1
MPILTELTVGDDADSWGKAGFSITKGNYCMIGDIRINLIGKTEKKRGIISWGFDNLSEHVKSIDAIPCSHFVRDTKQPIKLENENRSFALDHLVLKSNNFEETNKNLQKNGFILKRVITNPKTKQSFSFFRDGGWILEVLGSSSFEEESVSKKSELWGITLVVDDIMRTKSLLKNNLSEVRNAKQKGRKIATLRHKNFGMSVNIAFITPHVKTNK